MTVLKLQKAGPKAWSPILPCHRKAVTVTRLKPPLPGFALGSWTVGIAVHHSHRDLAYALDDAVVAALADGGYDEFASDEEVHTAARAARISAALEGLLKPGGLATTLQTSGQQWDAPNGWAPLQWVAVEGLDRYQQTALAQQIGSRFLQQVESLYRKENKLVEKYVLRPCTEHAGGGEYPLQDGFGWTNGVVQCWLDPRYDTEAAAQAIYYGPPDESLMRQSWADEPTAEDSATHGATDGTTDGTARGG